VPCPGNAAAAVVATVAVEPRSPARNQ
jgi:hypothetical protein